MTQPVPDFGTELSCTNDIARDGRVVTGFRVVAESIVRRWRTPKGRLIGYPNVGFDLTEYVNADVDARDINELETGAAAEAEQDERVEKCTVTATLESSGTLRVVGTVDTAQGPFRLVVAVSQVTVTLLEVQPS